MIHNCIVRFSTNIRIYNKKGVSLVQKFLTPSFCFLEQGSQDPPLFPGLCRLQTNRGYKKTNRNTDFWPMIFVSYNRIRIFKIVIPIRMKGIRIFKKNIPFVRNRIPKINRIFRLQTNMIEFIWLERNISGYTGINLFTHELVQI
jgi:hypothetical protein